MRNNKLYYHIILIIILITSCVEPIDLKTLEYENFLIVEATITNEFKQHEIKLSRTFEIDLVGPRTELNADVHLIDSDAIKYNFIEVGNGIYKSSKKISINKNKSYTLKIKTKNGKTYTSSSQKLTNNSNISNLDFLVTKNNLEEDGVSINVNSFNPNKNSNYYRYQYEETYKIIAPYWSLFSLEIGSEWPPKFKKKSRNINTKTCYKTEYSKEIIQTETKSLNEDRVNNFSVKFIPIRDFKLSHRYSILVKQYIQNRISYNYYNTLNKLSSNNSFFSQVQTGFIQGNMISETDINEKVIGFFELSSVSKKRLFFNKEQVTNETDYIEDCVFFLPALIEPMSNFSPLVEVLRKNDYIYYEDEPSLQARPYRLVKKSCGDCTVLGTNIKPNFWID